MRQVQDGDLPLQPAWAPATRLHYEFPCSTSVPAALLSPDNPYLGSTIFQVTSHTLPLSSEQTEAWVNGFGTISITPYNIAELMDPYIPDIQVSKWTSVEADDELLRTLLRSYFLHDYANYTCFQKDIFLQAMRDGDPRFCSPLLANAVLAEACHSCRKATHLTWRSETLGYAFLTEAKRLLEQETSNCKLTTLHATMVLHTIYTMNGMDQVGISYLLRAVQIAQDLKLFAPEQTEGRTRTACVFTAWALYRWQSLQAFHNLKAPLIRGPPGTPMADPDEEPLWYGELWLRYPPSLTLVPMHFAYVYRAQTELRHIANVITCIKFTGQKDARTLPGSATVLAHNAHVYVSSAMCWLIRDCMTNVDITALRQSMTWKDDQVLVPHYVRSTFLVTAVTLEEDWNLGTVEILAKKYDQLALEANEGDSSTAITLNDKSEKAG
ncbi:hypothetical protein FPANT_8068 [Fusarium pseudoanthophilum]|uniref:Xylanolytic transcriptional activator regulatory domain-containing protein n=1 Tax=Fusarium pseudoanthophilum TaxID=48495 RepID=A0A8H5NZ54_9HYPO|nr:hypothetical protein FPANT_8068 [Fusarium pseudoanthophilum]